ncbi:MAG: hypothetical protein V1918_09540 [Planctomycetota bacterium]
MPRHLLAVLLCLTVPGTASAHLCNDVFAQARDNLAVKVDIRDGQLRIGTEASFRVYVLNTMDRDIDEIDLKVDSKEFEATVAPSEGWKGFPKLKTVKLGGRKESFTVTLRRKKGVPDGTYPIDLQLYSRRQRKAFKTMDLGEAAGLYKLPRAGAVAIDGRVEATEWGPSAAATVSEFHECLPARGQDEYPENRPARDSTRFRLSCDEKNLYCLLVLEGAPDASADIGTLYVARTLEATPVTVSLRRSDGAASSRQGSEGVESRLCADTDASGKSLIECRIPRALLGIEGARTFYMNFTRSTRENREERVVYWRGNPLGLNDPMVYGQFVVED